MAGNHEGVNRRKKFALQPLRDKVRALLDALLESESRSLLEVEAAFLKMCGQYLRTGQTSHYTEMSSIAWLDEIEVWDRPKERLTEMLARLEFNWKQVVWTYAKAKAAALA